MQAQNTTNWQVYIKDSSIILRDVDDIAQCVYLILTTIPGTDPLRPLFGSNVYTYIDKPMTSIEPMLVFEVYDSVGRWENRLRVSKVDVVNWDFDKKKININGFITSSSVEVVIEYNL